MDCLILKQVFRYLNYQEVAQNRQVCKKFKEVGNNLLNKNFARICRDITYLVKKNLKRRWMFVNNSEKLRKKHILSTNSILLLLRAVFGRYITSGRCSFFPGLVIDYADKIIYNIKSSRTESLDQRLLKKLYIYSRNAMEHFELHIEPDLPGPLTFSGTKILDTLSTCCHLQAVETKRPVFFNKVCAMFPKDLPIYLNHKHDTTRLYRLRKQVLASNNSWLIQQLHPINSACDVKSRNGQHLSNMKTKETEIQEESSLEISKQEQSSTSTDETILKIKLPPPGSVSTSKELVQTMVDTRTFIQESQNELCSNKRTYVMENTHPCKKYCNFKPFVEETQTNIYVSQKPEAILQDDEVPQFNQQAFPIITIDDSS